MNCLLTSAIRRCELVPPGIVRILVTNWADDLVFIHDNSKPFIYTEIQNLGEWYDLDPRGAKFEVAKQDGNNGDLFLETLEVSIQGVDFSKTENADVLSRGKFMFVIRTVHGFNQVLGVHAGLRLDTLTAGVSDNENLYRIAFTGLNIALAPYVLDEYVDQVAPAGFSSGFSIGFS